MERVMKSTPVLFLSCFLCFIFISDECDLGGCDDLDIEILENPKTHVALINDVVNLTCTSQSVDLHEIHLLFNEEINSNHLSGENLAQRGIINFGCTKLEVPSDVGTCYATFHVNENSSDYSVQCAFQECCSEKAVIHVVAGIPEPPGAPSVTILNSQALSITWDSPWIYPVINYTLIIASNNSELDSTVLTTNTSYTVNKPDGYDCETMEFTVSANTDIGMTNFSTPIIRSFPTDISSVQLSDDELNVNTLTKFECGGGVSTYTITVKRLNDVCPNEVVYYQFDVLAIGNEEMMPVVVVPNVTDPALFFQPNKHTAVSYEWELVSIAVNEANEKLNKTEILDISNVMTISKNTFVHPTTTVALLNSTGNFTCWSEDLESNLTDGKIIVNGRLTDNSTLLEKGITVQLLSIQDKYVGYSVSVPATVDTNQTRIQCFLSPCITNEAIMIVVNSAANAVNPPQVININDTVLNISWQSPWPHPVNEYKLIISSLGQDRVNYSTKNTFFLFHDRHGFECKQLSITVQAITDIGITNPSNLTRMSFFKGLKHINRIESTKSYSFMEPNLLQITFLKPLTCDHEILTYNFILRLNNGLQQQKTVVNISSLKFILSGDFLLNNFSVSANVSDGMNSAYIILFDSIVYTNVTTTTQPPVDNSAAEVGIIVASVVAGLFIIIVIVILVLFTCRSYLG